MKQIILSLFALILFSCNTSHRNLPAETSVVTFKDLDSINGKSNDEIEKYLSAHEFTFLNHQESSDQWQSSNREDIVQFNGKKVLVFLTYNKQKNDSLLAGLQNAKYKSIGIDIKNNLEVESFTKEKETVFITSMENPENSKKIYSFTFLD